MRFFKKVRTGILGLLLLGWTCMGGDRMFFYPNGNANGFPTLSVRRVGRTGGKELFGVYRNGNCNGHPDFAIAGAESLRDAAEFFFLCFGNG